MREVFSHFYYYIKGKTPENQTLVVIAATYGCIQLPAQSQVSQNGEAATDQ